MVKARLRPEWIMYNPITKNDLKKHFIIPLRFQIKKIIKEKKIFFNRNQYNKN